METKKTAKLAGLEFLKEKSKVIGYLKDRATVVLERSNRDRATNLHSHDD